MDKLHNLKSQLAVIVSHTTHHLYSMIICVTVMGVRKQMGYRINWTDAFNLLINRFFLSKQY